MNKVAFITGASRGIGRETAIAFARAGFDVAISARTLEEGETHAHALTHADGRPLAGSLAATAAAIREHGREAFAVRMDLLNEQSVRGAAAAVLARFGRVDVLVNNAIYQGSDLNLPFMSLGLDTLERVFQGYVMAPVVLTQCLLPTMLAQGGGTVINVSSGAGESDPPVAASKGGWGYAYGAGKGAVSRLSGVLAAELGEGAHVLPCDLSDAVAVEALPKRAIEAMGALDVLVNNAGVTRDQLMMRMSDADWATVLEVNLTSVMRLSRGALRGMMKARWGRIINISSIVGVTGNPGQANYAASKAAVIGMSKSLAAEVASRGITVNCVAPGFIETAMTEALTDDQKARLLGGIPAGRMGTADEIAAAVVYLASAEAAYITGQTLHINGGMAMI